MAYSTDEVVRVHWRECFAHLAGALGGAIGGIAVRARRTNRLLTRALT